MTNYIYALQDPITDEIRYVGKSINPEERLKYHIKHLKREANTWKSRWITKLLNQGLSPQLIILEEVVGRWQEAEMFWIAYLKSIGCRLTNLTEGGDKDMKACWSPKPKPAKIPRTKGVNSRKGTKYGPIKNSKKTYLITDPQGIQYTVKSIHHFAKTHAVSETALHRALRGAKGNKGYTCILI